MVILIHYMHLYIIRFIWKTRKEHAAARAGACG